MERISMEGRKKAFEVYGSFDEWVRAHKHSPVSIENELYDSLEREGSPVRGLESYIDGLEDIRSVIGLEISEARDWIDYLKPRGD